MNHQIRDLSIGVLVLLDLLENKSLMQSIISTPDLRSIFINKDITLVKEQSAIIMRMTKRKMKLQKGIIEIADKELKMLQKG